MIHKTLYSLKEYLEKMIGSGVTVELERVRKDADAKEHDIVITLLHIEEETSRKPQSCYWTMPSADSTSGKARAGDKVLKSPDIDINLTILVSSQATQYETALKQISDVISIMNSVKTAPKPAKLSDETFESVKSLNISLQNMSFEQNLSMWQSLGGSIVPSAVYKVRMLTVAGVPDTSAIKEIKKVSIEPTGMDGQGKEPVTISESKEVSTAPSAEKKKRKNQTNKTNNNNQ